MAKIVDLHGHWLSAIGSAFVAFGSIEHTTIVCLRKIPRDEIQRFAKSLKLAQRLDLLLKLLEAHQNAHCTALSEKLRQVKLLLPTRNLIVHNPLVLEFFQHDTGAFSYAESIAAIHRKDHRITLTETQEFAATSERLASELIHASLNAFRALGWPC